MLLYPDMRRKAYEASDHLVFAAPCSEADWWKLRMGASSDNSHLPFTFITEGRHTILRDATCIILVSPHTPDDDVINTAAWIRVTKEYTAMIYAVPFDPGYQMDSSTAAIIVRTAGVDPKQVRHIEIPTTNQQEENP